MFSIGYRKIFYFNEQRRKPLKVQVIEENLEDVMPSIQSVKASYMIQQFELYNDICSTSTKLNDVTQNNIDSTKVLSHATFNVQINIPSSLWCHLQQHGGCHNELFYQLMFNVAPLRMTRKKCTSHELFWKTTVDTCMKDLSKRKIQLLCLHQRCILLCRTLKKKCVF